MLVTPEILHQISHTRAGAPYAAPLSNAMRAFEINTPARATHFLAQAATESAGFTRPGENLNYSEAALLRTFPTHFSALDAASFAHHPDRIANRVYGSRMGNGPECTGDGWKYRGRGLIGITGKYEYARCGTAFNVDLLRNPGWLEWPSWAARSAAWFWHDRGLNALADAGDLHEITRRINGGTNGMDTRAEYLKRAQAALGITGELVA